MCAVVEKSIGSYVQRVALPFIPFFLPVKCRSAGCESPLAFKKVIIFVQGDKGCDPQREADSTVAARPRDDKNEGLVGPTEEAAGVSGDAGKSKDPGKQKKLAWGTRQPGLKPRDDSDAGSPR